MRKDFLGLLEEVAYNAINYNLWLSTRVPLQVQIRRDRALASGKYSSPGQFAGARVISEDITRDINVMYDDHSLIGRKYGVEVRDSEGEQHQYWWEYDMPRIFCDGNRILDRRDDDFNAKRDQKMRFRVLRRLRKVQDQYNF